jgi:hypothetical protein
MKATITSPPPPPKPPIEITLTMSERDARIMTAFIGTLTQECWRKFLKDNLSDVKDILPSDFDIDVDLRSDIGYRLFDTMSKLFDTIK